MSLTGPRTREFAVKAFLLEVRRLRRPQEPLRNPTWFRPDLAKHMLARRREFRYSKELILVIDKAIDRIQRRVTLDIRPDGGGRFPLKAGVRNTPCDDSRIRTHERLAATCC